MSSRIGSERPSLRDIIEATRRVEPDLVSTHLESRRVERHLMIWLGATASLVLVGGVGVMAREFGTLLGG
jgi:hypothetical protein